MGTGCASSFALSLQTPLSLSLLLSFSLRSCSRSSRPLLSFRLSTDHTIRLLSRYRPIVCRANGGMRDNCATLQNAFGAISIYPSIEDIYTSNSFSRRELLDLRDLSVSSRIRFYNLFLTRFGEKMQLIRSISINRTSFVRNLSFPLWFFSFKSFIYEAVSRWMDPLLGI